MAHMHRPVTQGKEPELSKSYVDSKGYNFQAANFQSSSSYFALLFFVLFIMLFANLNAPPIYILDEARNAQCAREMMQHHDFIVPTFNGQLRTDKPPLHYYFMILSYKIFGVSAFAARFFSGMMGLLTVIVIALFAKRFLGRKVAFITAIVLSCSTHFLFEFRLAVPDPYLIFFMTLGLTSGFTWLVENKQSYLYLAAASLALGTLAKGPIAIVLPAICFSIFSLYKKRRKTAFTLHLLPAALLYVLIALPWYYMVHKATNGAWTNAFFFDHNINRFSTSREGHTGLFLLPLVVSLLGLLPFSAFLLMIVRKRKFLISNDALFFSVLVFSVIIIFFSFSGTQLPNYPMPAYPFAAVVIGNFLNKLLNSKLKIPSYPLYIVTGFLFVVTVGAYFALRSEPQTIHLAKLAGLILLPLALLVFIIMKRKHMSNLPVFYGLAGSYLLFNFIVLAIVYPTVYKNNPVSKTINIVKSANSVMSYGHYNSAFNFYLDKPIKRFRPNQIDSLKTLPAGTVVLTCSTHFKEIDSLHFTLLAREHDVFEGRETLVFLK